MNRYDLEHATTAHPLMSPEALEAAYHHAWRVYYSPEHIDTVLRRAIPSGIKPVRMVAMLFQFFASPRYEKIHPLQAGFIRIKQRRQRRSGMPLEHRVPFYLRLARDALVNNLMMLHAYVRIRLRAERIRRDPAAADYTDTALTPVENNDQSNLELFKVTVAAQQTVIKAQDRAAKIDLGLAGARASAKA